MTCIVFGMAVTKERTEMDARILLQRCTCGGRPE
jgi:hypothetical protein